MPGNGWRPCQLGWTCCRRNWLGHKRTSPRPPRASRTEEQVRPRILKAACSVQARWVWECPRTHHSTRLPSACQRTPQRRASRWASSSPDSWFALVVGVGHGRVGSAAVDGDEQPTCAQLQPRLDCFQVAVLGEDGVPPMVRAHYNFLYASFKASRPTCGGRPWRRSPHRQRYGSATSRSPPRRGEHAIGPGDF
jgi:hypothetical protein